MKHYTIRQSITDRSSISVNLYLKDIAKYPLLTEDQEVELVSKIKQGDKKAAEELVKGNLRFVVSIAKQYQGKGIEFADLISVGNLGLMRAVTDFDTSHGFKFISYAVWWIRDYILKEIMNNGKTIRVPTGRIIAINKINRLYSEFEQKEGRPPTTDELVELTKFTEEEIKDYITSSTITIVQDTVNIDGEQESLFDTLEIEEGNTDQKLHKIAVTTSILDFLKTNLNEIEYNVLVKFFGIECTQMNLDTIGEEYNITKERVRQIKDKAIIKLRKSDKVEELMKFL